jgi:stress-induced morphogen
MIERKLPAPLRRLVKALRTELSAEVEAERIPGSDDLPDRFRLAVVSPKFRTMKHLRRQDVVWKIVDRVLDPDEQLSLISLILAFSPNELESAGNQKR